MKKTLLFAFSLMLVTTLFARPATMLCLANAKFTLSPDTLELYDTLGHKINNLSVTYNSTNPSVDLMTGYIWAKNTTGTDMSNVFVKRTVNQQAATAINSFCFGINCYSPTTNVSAYAATLSAGAMDKSFLADFYPSGNGGLTSITYEFYDDVTFGKHVSAKATILFSISGVGIDEEKVVFNGLYPNPASQTTCLEYNIPSSFKNVQLVIRNILGVEIENISLENRSGKLPIDVSKYASGIYFYTLFVDGKIEISKKLIIKH